MPHIESRPGAPLIQCPGCPETPVGWVCDLCGVKKEKNRVPPNFREIFSSQDVTNPNTRFRVLRTPSGETIEEALARMQRSVVEARNQARDTVDADRADALESNSSALNRLMAEYESDRNPARESSDISVHEVHHFVFGHVDNVLVRNRTDLQRLILQMDEELEAVNARLETMNRARNIAQRVQRTSFGWRYLNHCRDAYRELYWVVANAAQGIWEWFRGGGWGIFAVPIGVVFLIWAILDLFRVLR